MTQIILVEDDSTAALLIKRYAETLLTDYQLTIFPNATQTLAWVKHNPADLFILDIQLPDYRGTELGKQLRALPDHRFTPILFATELAGEELSAYREIKCYDFLVKPFTEEQFQKAVTAALEMGKNLAKPPALLRIEQKQFVLEYELENVLYIESFGKQTVIHTITEGKRLEDTISGYSLTRLLELAPGHLLQCHKSYLINPQRLSRIDKRERQLWLKDCDTPIPIGERYQRNLHREGK